MAYFIIFFLEERQSVSGFNIPTTIFTIFTILPFCHDSHIPILVSTVRTLSMLVVLNALNMYFVCTFLVPLVYVLN